MDVKLIFVNVKICLFCNRCNAQQECVVVFLFRVGIGELGGYQALVLVSDYSCIGVDEFEVYRIYIEIFSCVWQLLKECFLKRKKKFGYL